MRERPYDKKLPLSEQPWLFSGGAAMNIQQLKELKISDIAEAMESCAEGYAALVCDSLEFSLEREMAESEHQTIFSAIEAALNSSERLEAAERANSAQSDHINQQQDRIDSLEQKNAALGKALGTAERERDELKASLIAASNMQSIHREACQKAESELARRDKEAGEPVAYIHESQLPRIKAECGVQAWLHCYDKKDGDVALYTAAQPSALPPKMKYSGNVVHSYFVDGYDEAIADVKALGVKPMRVTLPAVTYCQEGNPWFEQDEIIEALKAQGIEVEE